MVIGYRTADLAEPAPPAAGDVHGNLQLIELVELARLMGTWQAVNAQFRQSDPPWLTECTGCGRRIVTSPSWVRRGFVQCTSRAPSCLHGAVHPAYPSSDEGEALLAPAQSEVWTQQFDQIDQHGRRDLHAALAAMRARVR